jgi:hypothetical protein
MCPTPGCEQMEMGLIGQDPLCEIHHVKMRPGDPYDEQRREIRERRSKG